MSSAERAAFYASASIDGGTPLSPEAFAEAIEAQTTASVKAFAAKVGASKPVAVVTGDIDDVPFYDDLKL
jgi:predicted Zn-dependent peptidase